MVFLLLDTFLECSNRIITAKRMKICLIYIRWKMLMSARGQTRMTKNENASPSKECLQGLCGLKMFMTLTTQTLRLETNPKLVITHI